MPGVPEKRQSSDGNVTLGSKTEKKIALVPLNRLAKAVMSGSDRNSRGPIVAISQRG